MRVLLLHLDGKLPNVALMRLSSHHKALGDEVVFRRAGNPVQVEVKLWDPAFDRVYASLIFTDTRPLARRVLEIYPHALLGGYGWDPERSRPLESIGITTREQDYSLYPGFSASIGFTQRGCRLRCSFCGSRFEGKVQAEQSIRHLYRGEPWPKHLHLLDNDFFGQGNWRSLIADIRGGGFRVCFNQGINIRFLTDETAGAIASVKFSDDQFRRRRIYTAWDNRKDQERVFAGLKLLVAHGVKPDEIMVYVLVGYDHEQRAGRARLVPDDFYRWQELRAFGCRPYPMPFIRNKQTVGFQRWIVGAYDKRVSWADWERAGYRPAGLGELEMDSAGGNLIEPEEEHSA
ncbi:MAG TPA: hypothetical protein VEZ90_05320 [Blastocatellia bacterium]|nr:hypothetical protein [Blastocatellia bacterium]